MIDDLLALIVDESKWLTASLSLALVAVVVLLARYRHGGVAPPRVAVAAMSLCFALTIGTMAAGHLLAVTVKLALGTLEGSILVYYLIGVALAIPSLGARGARPTRACVGPNSTDDNVRAQSLGCRHFTGHGPPQPAARGAGFGQRLISPAIKAGGRLDPRRHVRGDQPWPARRVSRVPGERTELRAVPEHRIAK